MKINRLTMLACLFAVLLLAAGQALGASSILTKHEVSGGIGYFDLTVTIDWEPTQEEKDGFLKTAFEQFAKDVFKMSEGKQKLRKLYVYTNSSNMGTSDIRFLKRAGRANANANGIFKSGGRILTYTHFSDGTGRTFAYMGHTMSHEFGHYALGLYDEYRGSSRTTARGTSPRSGDTSKDTIMHHQGNWQWLSTPEDYTVGKATAQWRGYSASAWDVLARNKNRDPRNPDLALAHPRNFWQEFKDFDYPKKPADLTKPIAGWDEKFEIIYMGGEAVVVLSIDVSGSMGWGASPTGIQAARTASQAFVDQLQPGDHIAVVTFESGYNIRIPVTKIVDETTKTTIKNSLATMNAGGGTNFTAALSGPRIAMINAGMYGQEFTRYVILMSDGQAGRPTNEIETYKAQGIPVYTIGLGDGIQPAELQYIASQTGGQYFSSPTAQELAAVYQQVGQRTTAGVQQPVAASEGEVAAAGAQYAITATLSPLDGQSVFRATWAANAPMEFTLTMPDGTLVDSANAQALGYTYSASNTAASYIIPDPPAAGGWGATVTATGVPANPGVGISVITQSPLTVALDLTGGNYPAPLQIMATVTAPEPVTGADVIAFVTHPDGVTVTAVPLRDDGLIPDYVADDGVYSGAMLPEANGTYTVKVSVKNPLGKAALDTGQALEGENGVDLPPVPLAPFERIIFNELVVAGQGAWSDGSTPPKAIFVDTENNPVPGAILNDFDEMWFWFNGTEGDRLYLMTSDLFSTDPLLPMATDLTLYADDATTELGQSARHQGTGASLVEWVCPADGVYYIKVTHASPGTGTFSLTVGPNNLFPAPDALPAQPAGPTGPAFSTTSGCFITSLE